MHVLLELHQNHIAKLEAQLNAQERTVNKLKEKMDRQEAFPLVMLASINKIPDTHCPIFPPMLLPMPMRHCGHSVSIFNPHGQFLDIMDLVRGIGDSQACHFISDMAEAMA